MKRYLITGASRGIGRAIAEKIADDETILLLHGRDRDALAETCRLVGKKGGLIVPLIYDLRDKAEVMKLIAEVGAEPLDGLINNAGVAWVKPLGSVSLDEWETTFAINVTAAFLLTQKLTAKMPAGASVVNILSVAARTGFGNWSTYCMSKFALEGFSQAVREELRPRGIRVINIYPAATNTEMWEGIAGDWPREKMMSAGEAASAVAFALAQPDAIAVESISLSHVAGSL